MNKQELINYLKDKPEEYQIRILNKLYNNNIQDQIIFEIKKALA